ncbi:MAG: hypothetical protein GY882_13025 [Actinomycetia bacterium]|nr:hypothetical protein [Actinomycetes bacterium]
MPGRRHLEARGCLAAGGGVVGDPHDQADVDEWCDDDPSPRDPDAAAQLGHGDGTAAELGEDLQGLFHLGDGDPATGSTNSVGELLANLVLRQHPQ